MKLKVVVFLSLIIGLVLVSNKIIFARDGGPAASDPDINIRDPLRGWVSASFPGGLVDHSENTDHLAPQLSTLIGDGVNNNPTFGGFFQVRAKGGSGLDLSNLSSPGMATIQAQEGQTIKVPDSGHPIGGGFAVVVLYATDSDIVIHYGLEDSAAVGYTIHILNINVEPTIKDLYDNNEADGRKQLVALPCGELLGTVKGGGPLVSIRDTGSFMDIRFKDWWTQPLQNCESGALPGFITPTTPQSYDTSTEIPCNQNSVPPLTNPEFHSLRPYPANPCLKTVQDTTLMCSNDLVAIKATSPAPGYESSRTAPGVSGSYTVTYSNVPERVPVAIDLANSQLPILGDTEDVPNATWTSPNTSASNLTPTQRVNGFVSWYLNGVVNHAEEDLSGFDSNNLVNYSGPLNKLLPWAGQVFSRIVSINNADQTAHGDLTPNGDNLVPASEKNVRHNQVVGCQISGQIGIGMMPCYLDIESRIISLVKLLYPNADQNIQDVATIYLTPFNRLIDWLNNKPPDESDYKDFSDYWQAYLKWRGQTCTPKLFGTKFYFCFGVGGLNTNIFAMLFDYVPLSTTEDRVGLIGTSQINSGGSNFSLTNSDLNSAYLQNLVAQAANWANVPANVLVALIHGEACQGGGPLCSASDTDVENWSSSGGVLTYNCVGTAAGGPLGFNSLIWSNAKNAVNVATGENRTPNVCNVKDAIYAAAAVIAGTYKDACYHGGTSPASGTWDQIHVNSALTAWACGCGGEVPSCHNANQLYLTSPYIGNSVLAQGGNAASAGVTFTPDAGTNYQHNLYFAHAQETVELAKQLQNTFKSIDQTAPSNHEDNTKPDIAPGCVIADSRSGPGDSFHGDVNRDNDLKISGTVNFLATYTCTFTPVAVSGVSGATFQNSVSNSAGLSGGYTYTCNAATGSLSIFTKSPELQNGWDILVGGTQSIFKRFFPQTGANSPVSEIKETPAQTNATYEATAGDAVAAGSGTSGGGTTASANVYIPYVGGIKDYFLDAIQTALRPQGMGGSSSLSSGGVTFPGGKVPAGLCSPSNMSSFGSNASTMSCICQYESNGNPFIVNKGSADYSIGLFQINLLYNPSVVPEGLRQMFIRDNVPNANSVSCYQAFNNKNSGDIKPGYQQVVQDCVNWYVDPVNNIAEAHSILSSIGLNGGWLADKKYGCF